MRNLLLLLLFFCSSCFVVAQESSGVFRYGKLKNGLTYYIRHTEVQSGYADYYLVQNVGSLLEDDNQNGLAHVLEHMAFHSTQSFPDGVPAFLQRHGVETFNAVTKYDETIYHIDHVPTASRVLVDSCVLVLRMCPVRIPVGRLRYAVRTRADFGRPFRPAGCGRSGRFWRDRTGVFGAVRWRCAPVPVGATAVYTVHPRTVCPLSAACRRGSATPRRRIAGN